MILDNDRHDDHIIMLTIAMMTNAARRMVRKERNNGVRGSNRAETAAPVGSPEGATDNGSAPEVCRRWFGSVVRGALQANVSKSPASFKLRYRSDRTALSPALQLFRTINWNSLVVEPSLSRR